MHVPQIPQTDNPYELAMHAGNVRYYEQHSVNPRQEALEAASVAICAEGIVAIAIMAFAWLFVWAALPQ